MPHQAATRRGHRAHAGTDPPRPANAPGVSAAWNRAPRRTRAATVSGPVRLPAGRLAQWRARQLAALSPWLAAAYPRNLNDAPARALAGGGLGPGKPPAAGPAARDGICADPPPSRS